MTNPQFTTATRVSTYDIDGSIISGTIHPNPPYSDWYVKYDDGEECIVLDMSLIWIEGEEPIKL